MYVSGSAVIFLFHHPSSPIQSCINQLTSYPKSTCFPKQIPEFSAPFLFLFFLMILVTLIILMTLMVLPNQASYYISIYWETASVILLPT